MDALSLLFPPLHKEGIKFIVVFAVATLLLFFIWTPLGWVGTGLTVWCMYFFRDPDRHTPQADNLVICPADGVICMVGEASPPPELEMPDETYMRICVFMNVFNCHVNRTPLKGEIVTSAYHPGKFLNASLDKASEDNERHGLRLRTDVAGDMGVVQIAGLVARRILCEVSEGDILEAGERFGIIRFGSRVDIYMRKDIAPLVSVGQTVVAGETVFADVSKPGEARRAEVR